ncbi:MAG: TlpA disulfide reductase family protein [Thermodesulfovibrio sp.]
MKRFFILIFLFLLIIPQQGQSSLKKGDFAPNFSFNGPNGESITLYQIRGNGIIIEFLSTKCFVCDYVVVDINRLYEKFKNRNIQIIGVLFNDEIKEPDKLIEYAKERGVRYPLFLSDVKVKKLFNIYGFPTFFILNKEKRIMQIYRGITQDTFGLLSKDIETLLKEEINV